MVFGTGRRDARNAKDPEEERRIPYRLLSYEHDQEGKRFKSNKVVYSFWSASKYVLILSIMLWWLPMFGQMIAGYVGGRRAGGPWKGVAASIIPVVALYCVMTGFEQGILPSHVFGVAIAPAAIATALNSGVPFLSPYIQFSSDYVGAFVSGLAGASPYGINLYVLTVAFAYVGGVLAEQNRREIEFSSGAVMTNTTVLVHDQSAYQQAQVEEAQRHGLFSGVGAFFHLPSRHHEGYPVAGAAYAPRRHRDPWAPAAEMHYVDEDDLAQQYALPAHAPMADRRSGGMMRRRKTRSLSQQQDPWHRKQKRRGATNYSSKPRFNYPQYESRPSFDNAGYKGGMIRRNKDVPRYVVAPNPKSIKRAQKMIDREWSAGRSRKYQSYRDDEEYDEVAVETEAPAPRRHERHSPSHEWDSM